MNPDWPAYVALVLLSVAALLFLVRLAMGPSLVDRIVALDGVLIVTGGAVAVNAARTGSALFLDVLAVIAFISFIGTAIVARFVERRGA